MTKKCARGFTLIEVAIALLAIVLFMQAAFILIRYNQRDTILTGERLQAHYAAIEWQNTLLAMKEDPGLKTVWNSSIDSVEVEEEKNFYLQLNTSGEWDIRKGSFIDVSVGDNFKIQMWFTVKKINFANIDSDVTKATIHQKWRSNSSSSGVYENQTIEFYL